MEIRLADSYKIEQIQRYDCHISSERLEACIRSQMVYVLLDGNVIVGVLRYSLFWQAIPFLDLVYIHQDYRERGCGRQMMSCWETEMQKAGFRYVMLSTQEDETAKHFYEKLGYRRIGAFSPPEQEAQELIYLKEM